MMTHLVIVEDQMDVLELVRYNLENEGWEVVGFAGGHDGLEYLRSCPPDLALLDIMLPDLSGLEICQTLRADSRTRTLPVIFLTAKGAEADRIAGFSVGADDYIVKPFSPRELIARVKAILRRYAQSSRNPEVLTIGDVRLDPSSQEVAVRGKPVDLNSLEFRLLYFLASRPRVIFGRDRLVEAGWGLGTFVTARSVDVQIVKLRQKIEIDPANPRHVQTARGSGYRFVP